MIPNPCYATASRTPTDLRMTESFPIIRGGRLSSTRARFSCRNLSTPRRCLKSCSSVTAGGTRGVTASTTMPIIIRASTRSSASHGAAVEVRFGGANGRALTLKAGDVAILPAGTGHQREKASEDFLVVGAYPTLGVYDECRSAEDREKALPAIDRVARPRKDPVYGKDGPLMHIWLARNREAILKKRMIICPVV